MLKKQFKILPNANRMLQKIIEIQTIDVTYLKSYKSFQIVEIKSNAINSSKSNKKGMEI